MHQKLVKNNWFTSFFVFYLSIYQAQNCNGSPFRGVRHQSKHNRIIEINHNPIRHKIITRGKFNTEEGIQKRKKDVTMLNQCLATSKATISSTSLCSVAKRK
jgi:hypothetical protein